MKAKPMTRKMSRLVAKQFTKGQRNLMKRHGTPADFAAACYLCVPDYIGMDEANTAIQKYQKEFQAA